MLRNRSRAVRVASSAAVVVGVFAVMPAAHATDEFPSYPWATIAHSCPDPMIEGGIFSVEMGNEAGAAVSVSIHLEATGAPDTDRVLDPGESTVVNVAAPGEDAHVDIVVTAEGGEVLDQFHGYANCETPVAHGHIDIVCGEHYPSADFTAESEGNSGPLSFELLLPDGTTTQWLVDAMMMGGYNLVEDAPYHVSISSEGVLLDEESGVADCFPNEEPTTTTTVVDDPDPEVPVVAEAATTTTTTPSTTTPSTTTTAAATLPRTGGSSAPIAMTGAGALALGAGLLAGLRRRRSAEER